MRCVSRCLATSYTCQPGRRTHPERERDTCKRRRSFTASFVGEDKSAEISPPRLMAQQIMAHVAAATGVPRVPFPVAAAHLKAV
eukprot:superscaffoldBa00003213_g16397